MIASYLSAALMFCATTLALPSRPVDSLAKLQLPTNTLPVPGSRPLKFILLGVGTQNYTCASTTDAVSPVAAGAVATLYDIGSKLRSDPFSTAKIRTIPGLAYNLHQSGVRNLDVWLKREGYSKVLGNHFFASSVPIFALDNVLPHPSPSFNGKKTANMTAPVDSCGGSKKEGAVDWLFLEDSGTTNGMLKSGAVYRVVTAGGKAPVNCKGMASKFEVPYTTEYWVYGAAS